MKLVIVESPGKIKTIQKYLGPGYTVKASVGHCYEIEPKDDAIDIDNRYEPRYIVSKKKQSVVKELKELAQKADEVFIASDPDREGEAIGWHIAKRALKCPQKTKRIVFHEITKKAVLDALKKPGELNEALFHAQQARAVLDRLVGFKVSPVLWRKVCKGTSAGRVQSIGLRLIVERQREIDAFVPEEYWSIEGLFKTPENEQFKAAYVSKEKVTNKEQATRIKKTADEHKGSWGVSDVELSSKKRTPYPIFSTSTLQQFCSSFFGWDGKKTMKVAQELYEGFSVKGNDPTGLISYHRTDSTNISEDALNAVRPLIASSYGNQYLPASPRVYKTKAKSAQEAHEGIRPSHLEYSLSDVLSSIPPDNGKLYEAIYRRFVSCQMTDALFDTSKVHIQADTVKLAFQATGQVMKFDGFLKVWTYGDSKDSVLPVLKKGEDVSLVSTEATQHFTKPPAAFNTASLVKTLEENGIGRPSTYASIVDTLLKREYAKKEGKSFTPTDLGKLVSDFLVQAFPEIMDTGFTARIEEQLDEIAEDKRVWYEAVDGFYTELKKRLEASKSMQSTKTSEETDITCPVCKKYKLVKRRGKFGMFYGCAGYTAKGKEKCKATFQIGDEGEPIVKVRRYLEGVKCDKCGAKIVIRVSKKKGTEFGGCSNFPKCKRIFSMDGEPIELKKR